MNMLSIIVKIITILMALVCIGLTIWSAVSKLPAIMTVVGALLTLVFIYFSYQVVRALFVK